MKVKFLESCEIEVFDSFDEALDDGETSTEVFMPGHTAEFDVIGHPEKMEGGKLVPATDFVNVQFGNGSVAFGLDKAWFETLE